MLNLHASALGLILCDTFDHCSSSCSILLEDFIYIKSISGVFYMILIMKSAFSYLQMRLIYSSPENIWSFCFWLFQYFKFDRFLSCKGKEKTFFKDKLRINYGSMPWGAGSSLCPGREFAVCAVKRWVLTGHTLHQTIISAIKIINNKSISIISRHLWSEFTYSTWT